MGLRRLLGDVMGWWAYLVTKEGTSELATALRVQEVDTAYIISASSSRSPTNAPSRSIRTHRRVADFVNGIIFPTILVAFYY